MGLLYLFEGRASTLLILPAEHLEGATMKNSRQSRFPKFLRSTISLALILAFFSFAPNANAAPFTVTYVGTGSTSGTAPVDTNQYSSGSSFTILGSGTLLKKCYDFGGWQNASIAPSQPGTIYPISNNVSLAPYWTPVGGNTYTLTFNGNGNTTGPVPSALVGCGMFTLPAPGTMTKACSTFLGWSPSPTLGSPSGYALAGDPFDLGGNSTWYALWTPVPCTLTFDANGGAGNVPGGISGPGNVTLPGQGTLTLACFTFGGWSLSGNAPAVTSPFQVTGNAILKAIWISNGNCGLTFDANGGTGNVPGAISGPGPVTLPGQGALTLACFTFGGWSLNGNAPPLTSPFQVTGNTILKAIWISNGNCILTFDANGGTGNVPGAISGPGPITLPGAGNLLKACSIFAGWTAVAGVGLPLTSLLISGPTTVFALWTAVPCTLTFDANGGTGNVPGAISGPGPVTLPGQGALTLACFTFGGWSLNGNAPPLTSPFQVTGNTILKAIWISNGNCILTFDANGGTGNVPGAISGPGPITLPGAGNLLKACSIFAGWTAVAGVGLPLTSLLISGPTTVFALWTAVTYTLTFDKNGGTGSAPIPIVGCGVISPLPGVGTMTNPGNTFGGWSLSGNPPPLPNSYSLVSNTTLKAIWTPVTCTVTFAANGGTGPLPLPHVGCSPFTLPAPSSNLIEFCFNFQGWSLSGNGPAITFVPAYTPPTGITVLNAVWMHVTWKITYVKNGGTGNVPTPTLGCGLVTLKGNIGSPHLTKPGGVFWKGWLRPPPPVGGTPYNWPWGPLNYNLIANVTMSARYAP